MPFCLVKINRAGERTGRGNDGVCLPPSQLITRLTLCGPTRLLQTGDSTLERRIYRRNEVTASGNINN